VIKLELKKKHVVIIGGGITGLTAAFYLRKAIEENNLPISFTLVEDSDRLGGKIQTVQKDGFIIERGPDSFLERKVSAFNLVKELGLEDQLVRNNTGQAYILRGRKLYPIPEGAVMGIPTQLTPFIKTGLFSPAGKLRAAADLMLPRSNIVGDQSLGTFFRRRLGNEVVDRLIEPLLSGIYAGDLDKLSLMSTFPQFYETEKKYRSLILGMKKSTPTKPKRPTTEKQGVFLTLKDGLESLVFQLEKEIGSQNIMKDTAVKSIKKVESDYHIQLETGQKIVAQSVLATTPHNTTVNLFQDCDVFQDFPNMPATTVATVAMAFQAESIEINHDGTGFVVARDSDYTITACTWTHKKWPHSSPKGKVLLRCYVGKPDQHEIVHNSDEEIIKVVLEDLQKIIKVKAKPDFHVVSRWNQSMPQYLVGQKNRVEEARNRLHQQLPGVYIAGASYEGIGIPDCIKSGETAVEQLLSFL
jgi:oxygen-dependent protoporphyrinogen oxidase